MKPLLAYLPLIIAGEFLEACTRFWSSFLPHAIKHDE
jgi:hypothetical protein